MNAPRYLAGIFVVFYCLLVGCSGAAQPSTPDPTPTLVTLEPPDGTWRGSVDQAGSGDYTVVLVLSECASNSLCGTVSYPELSCGGTAAYLSSSGSTLFFYENITYGSRCVDGGEFTLQPLADDEWAWQWFWPSGRPGASATLKRDATVHP
jgi:hypothetical protein